MARLNKLKPLHFNLVELVTLLFVGRHQFNRFPRIIRFAAIHAGITFVTAANLPPVTELPAVAVPILWAGSFAMAYSLMAISGS